MHTVFIVSIVFGGIIIALAIIGVTVLMAIRLRHDGFSRKNRKFQADEAGMIQEIYHGLSGMEKRVETLETILMDRQEKESQQ